MATKVVKMSPKKKNSTKKKAKRMPFMEFAEVVRCFIKDYKIVERAPMLIYTRFGDKTIHAAWVHPDTKLSVMKKALKRQAKHHDSAPMYISLWQEAAFHPENLSYGVSQLVVRSIAETFDEATEMFRDPKDKGLNIMDMNNSKKVAR